MKIIYKYDDIENKRVSEKYKNEIINEFSSFHQSMGIKESIYDFSLEKYGVLCLAENEEDVENIFYNKELNGKYFNLEFENAEAWILSTDKLYLLKLISSDNKLLELFIENKYYIKLPYSIKMKIEKNLVVIKRYDGKKQIIKVN